MELTLFGFPLPLLSESHMNSDMKTHRSLIRQFFFCSYFSVLYLMAVLRAGWSCFRRQPDELSSLPQVSTETEGLR